MLTSPKEASGEIATEQLVDSLYQIVLGRKADPDGLSHHAALLRDGMEHEALVAKLTGSDEFKQKGGFRTMAERLGVAEGQGDADHPLTAWPYIYTASSSPYFSHRDLFRPLMLIIETVNICNNDCVICPYSSQTRARRIMDNPTFEKIVQQYSDIGGGHVSLTPVVGEIFLDKQLATRLEVVKRYPAIEGLSATTNATMARRYDDAKLTDILSRFKRLKISVYGFDAEEFGAMTRKDDFDECNAQMARILGLAPSGSVVLGLRNLKPRSRSEVSDWVGSLAEKAGVAVPQVVSAADEYANWSFLDTSKPLPFAGKWKKTPRNAEQCLVPLIALQAMVDGTISFCACANFDADEGLTLGRVDQRSLREMLTSARYLELWNWKRNGVPAFCQTCSFHLPMEAAKGWGRAYADPISFIGA